MTQRADVRVLGANIQINRMGGAAYGILLEGVNYEVAAGQDQLEAIARTKADVLLLQEQTGKWVDAYCNAGWPHTAEKNLRYLSNERYATRQLVAVQTSPEMPINDTYGVDLGYLHADGVEVVPELSSLGRQVRASAIAAEVVTPEGARFLAVSTHGTWTPRADQGVLLPHQTLYFQGLSTWLGSLKALNLPMVLAGDFNCRLVDCLHLLPSWLTLLTPIQGTSLDLPEEHPLREKLTDRDVYLDAILTYGDIACENVEVIRGYSDHVWHLAELKIRV